MYDEDEAYNSTERSKRAVREHKKRLETFEVESPTFPPIENDYIEGKSPFRV